MRKGVNGSRFRIVRTCSLSIVGSNCLNSVHAALNTSAPDLLQAPDVAQRDHVVQRLTIRSGIALKNQDGVLEHFDLPFDCNINRLAAHEMQAEGNKRLFLELGADIFTGHGWAFWSLEDTGESMNRLLSPP